MSSIPSELMKLKNWAVYEQRTTPECISKLVLIDPKTGHDAKRDDSSTWSDYQSAEARAKSLENGRVCFMFGEPGKPSGVAAINIKNCYEESKFEDGEDKGFDWVTGERRLKPYASEIVSLMDSYTEYIPVAGGVRIFFKTTKSLHELNASIDKFTRNSALDIEVCDSVLFCEVTGDGFRINGAVKPVNERTEQARQVIAKYFTQESSEPEPKPIEFHSDAEYLDTGFEADIADFKKYSERKTGFANLDSSLVLYPALYFIGAVSSLGKTTLCLQLADNLSAMGEHVLYFAFEQTRLELVSKSLARLSQPEGAFYDSKPSAMQIRRGAKCEDAKEKFRAISQHKQIIECDFETDINRVIDTVNAYIKQFGVKPVVFLDYMQLISSNKKDKPKLTNTKDIVDSNVRALKLLQMRNNLVMFVVSSLNRQNYNQVIDFEAFKETGGIEYTADCVMGLQLSVMNASIFETDTKTGEKRKLVRAAKKQKPRYLELCILKNRYGICNESFYFMYYPQYDMFVPTTRDITKQVTKELLEKVKGKTAK